MNILKKIKKIPLKVIKNNAGDIIKYLDKKNSNFNKFGEIYFTKIKRNHVKGWNLHKKTNCLISVPYGSVNFVFKDYKMLKSKKLTIEDNSPSILVIPPNVWFKFSTKKKYSIIINLIDRVHKKSETKKFQI